VAQGGLHPPAKFFYPLEKRVGHSLKLLGKVKKIWSPLRKSFASAGVPSWLGAWREVIDYVFCAFCMIFPDSAVSWNHQDRNRQSMQRVQNAWSIGTGLCSNARTQMYHVPFQTAIFFILVVRIIKGRQPLTEKPATDFPEFVYIIVILSYVFANNCPLNRLNL